MTIESKPLYDDLKALSDAMGVSGDESEVRQLILARIKDHVSEITIDPMGNLTAIRRGTGEESSDGSLPRVMISAHMDEIGFMVMDVGGDGLIQINAVGVHDPRMLPTQRLVVGKDKVPGMFAWAPIHQSHSQDVVKANELRIDIGVDDKGGVKAKPGERVAFAPTFAEVNGRIVRGKAFESRAGCAVLIDLLRGDPLPFDLSVAFTTQAAIRGRGAGVAAHRLNPQMAIALTGTICDDLPRPPDDATAPSIQLGGGPTLSLVDEWLVADPRLVAEVRAAAAAESIPLQLDALNKRRATGTAIGFARAAVPSVEIGVPIRYRGSPNALLNLDDLDRLARLLRAAVSRLVG